MKEPFPALRYLCSKVDVTCCVDMVDIVTVTCDGYTFPKNGRLVDKDNRTPLHLACMSEDIVFSTKVCAV